jgi:hypothetical protein
MGIAISAGCAGAPPLRAERPRDFVFERDTLAFANQLVWSYRFDDATGEVVIEPHGGEVSFGNRCNPMTRAIRQFHYAARFDADLPPLSEEAYRERVRQVLESDPRRTTPLAEPVVFPGHAGLRDFSRAHEALLKEELGGSEDSYLQRGNVRMIFPFLPDSQRETADDLVASVREGRPVIVHLVRFPKITINHTILVFDAEQTPREIRFHAFDPNHPEAPLLLRYQRARATFFFPRTAYFAGGPVDAYEIYAGVF